MSWISLNNICLICCIYIYRYIYTCLISEWNPLCHTTSAPNKMSCKKYRRAEREPPAQDLCLMTVFWPSSILPLHLSGLLLGENILREVSHYCFSNERKGCREGKKRTSSTLWKSFQGCYPEISGEKYLKKERHASACEGVPNIYSMSYMKPDQTETKIKTWINATA